MNSVGDESRLSQANHHPPASPGNDIRSIGSVRRLLSQVHSEAPRASFLPLPGGFRGCFSSSHTSHTCSWIPLHAVRGQNPLTGAPMYQPSDRMRKSQRIDDGRVNIRPWVLETITDMLNQSCHACFKCLCLSGGFGF